MADTPTPAEIADKAVATYKAGDMDTAIPLLRQALEFDKESFPLHMYLGLALGRKNKWADAERMFTRASEIDGSNGDAAYLLGVAILKQNRLREAHGQFMVAVATDPNHAKAKDAEAQTRAAAEQITTDGSSAMVPGGLAGLDLGGIEVEMGGKKTGVRGHNDVPSGDVANALAELEAKGKGAKGAKGAAKPKPQKAPQPQSRVKIGGRGESLSMPIVIGIIVVVAIVGIGLAWLAGSAMG